MVARAQSKKIRDAKEEKKEWMKAVYEGTTPYKKFEEYKANKGDKPTQVKKTVDPLFFVIKKKPTVKNVHNSSSNFKQ